MKKASSPIRTPPSTSTTIDSARGVSSTSSTTAKRASVMDRYKPSAAVSKGASSPSFGTSPRFNHPALNQASGSGNTTPSTPGSSGSTLRLLNKKLSPRANTTAVSSVTPRIVPVAKSTDYEQLKTGTSPRTAANISSTTSAHPPTTATPYTATTEASATTKATHSAVDTSSDSHQIKPSDVAAHRGSWAKPTERPSSQRSEGRPLSGQHSTTSTRPSSIKLSHAGSADTVEGAKPLVHSLPSSAHSSRPVSIRAEAAPSHKSLGSATADLAKDTTATDVTTQPVAEADQVEAESAVLPTTYSEKEPTVAVAIVVEESKRHDAQSYSAKVDTTTANSTATSPRLDEDKKSEVKDTPTSEPVVITISDKNEVVSEDKVADHSEYKSVSERKDSKDSKEVEETASDKHITHSLGVDDKHYNDSKALEDMHTSIDTKHDDHKAESDDKAQSPQSTHHPSLLPITTTTASEGKEEEKEMLVEAKSDRSIAHTFTDATSDAKNVVIDEVGSKETTSIPTVEPIATNTETSEVTPVTADHLDPTATSSKDTAAVDSNINTADKEVANAVEVEPVATTVKAPQGVESEALHIDHETKEVSVSSLKNRFSAGAIPMMQPGDKLSAKTGAAAETPRSATLDENGEKAQYSLPDLDSTAPIPSESKESTAATDNQAKASASFVTPVKSDAKEPSSSASSEPTSSLHIDHETASVSVSSLKNKLGAVPIYKPGDAPPRAFGINVKSEAAPSEESTPYKGSRVHSEAVEPGEITVKANATRAVIEKGKRKAPTRKQTMQDDNFEGMLTTDGAEDVVDTSDAPEPKVAKLTEQSPVHIEHETKEVSVSNLKNRLGAIPMMRPGDKLPAKFGAAAGTPMKSTTLDERSEKAQYSMPDDEPSQSYAPSSTVQSPAVASQAPIALTTPAKSPTDASSVHIDHETKEVSVSSLKNRLGAIPMMRPGDKLPAKFGAAAGTPMKSTTLDERSEKAQYSMPDDA